jgi:hypothetical protein
MYKNNSGHSPSQKIVPCLYILVLNSKFRVLKSATILILTVVKHTKPKLRINESLRKM